MPKTIITAALTGGGTPKSLNAKLPVTPKEIAEDAYRAWKAGAAVVHLHARDDEGKGTMDKEKFREMVSRIRDSCDVVVNLSSAGEHGASDERRMAHIVELRPEIASFDAGTINWMHKTVFLNPPDFLEKLARTLSECGVKPEVEVFDSGMLRNAEHYVETGALREPLHVQFVLGAPGGADATVQDLAHLVGKLKPGTTWSAFGIGKGHLPILYAALAMGGHVRVGLEDNLYYSKGRLASNAELVQRAVRVVEEFNGEVATPDEARAILGLAGPRPQAAEGGAR